MFEWLNTIAEVVMDFFPHRVIVLATHRGVKWKFGLEAIQLEPDVHWYWPMVSEVAQYPVARQTLRLPPQSLMTSDFKKVMVRGIVVYRISDIIAAYGEHNYDVDDTVSDIAQSCIFDLITGWTLEELMSDVEGNICAMTEAAQEALEEYGVEIGQVKLVSFTECRPLNHTGLELSFGTSE